MKTTAVGIAAASVWAAGAGDAAANPLDLPLGCQTYPVRSLVTQDFAGTVKTLADAGFTNIELCSPAGYSAFAPVGKYSGAELKKIFSDAGVTCVSSHFSMKELRDDLPGRIAWATDAGLTQMMVPSLGGPTNPTADDVKRAADEFNKIAAEVAKAGLQQGLHNEGFETSMVDGKRTYDALFGLLDPATVRFQFQVSTIAQGFDAAEYLNKYPGRFVSLHCQGWDAQNRKIVAIGAPEDALDWKRIFSAARTGGIKNYYVEMDLALMRASVPYLKSLRV